MGLTEVTAATDMVRAITDTAPAITATDIAPGITAEAGGAMTGPVIGGVAVGKAQAGRGEVFEVPALMDAAFEVRVLKDAAFEVRVPVNS